MSAHEANHDTVAVFRYRILICLFLYGRGQYRVRLAR